MSSEIGIKTSAKTYQAYSEPVPPKTLSLIFVWAVQASKLPYLTKTVAARKGWTLPQYNAAQFTLQVQQTDHRQRTVSYAPSWRVKYQANQALLDLWAIMPITRRKKMKQSLSYSQASTQCCETSHTPTTCKPFSKVTSQWLPLPFLTSVTQAARIWRYLVWARWGWFVRGAVRSSLLARYRILAAW